MGRIDPTRTESSTRCSSGSKATRPRSWRIVHIAGHGEPPDKKSGNPRGVVLSDDMFLGPSEIRSLRVVPELVFVNCCYLGASDRDRAAPPET